MRQRQNCRQHHEGPLVEDVFPQRALGQELAAADGVGNDGVRFDSDEGADDDDRRHPGSSQREWPEAKSAPPRPVLADRERKDDGEQRRFERQAGDEADLRGVLAFRDVDADGGGDDESGDGDEDNRGGGQRQPLDDLARSPGDAFAPVARPFRRLRAAAASRFRTSFEALFAKEPPAGATW